MVSSLHQTLFILLVGEVVLSHPSSSTSSVFPTFEADLNLTDAALECILKADIAGQDGSGCFPPSSVPLSECSCVPVWQCKDDGVYQAAVGGQLAVFVLDVRNGHGCGAPDEICCVEVDPDAPPPPLPPFSPLCGARNHLGIVSTIVGFEDQQTQFGEFPWTVVIFSVHIIDGFEIPIFMCGGSLVHRQAVLTVAHAVQGFTADQLRIRLGDWNLETETEAVPHQDFTVKQIVLHPYYHKLQQHYDVALLLLALPAVPTATVNTICLPSPQQHYLSDECVVSGWGKRHFHDRSRFQKVMKKVSLPLVDAATCQTALQDTRLGSGFILHHSFVCAGGQHEGQDTCTGDGGSPLACPMQNDPNRYVQVGVVAWGIGCGVVGRPGVYAGVEAALPWIEQVMGMWFGGVA